MALSYSQLLISYIWSTSGMERQRPKSMTKSYDNMSITLARLIPSKLMISPQIKTLISGSFIILGFFLNLSAIKLTPFHPKYAGYFSPFLDQFLLRFKKTYKCMYLLVLIRSLNPLLFNIWNVSQVHNSFTQSSISFPRYTIEFLRWNFLP